MGVPHGYYCAQESSFVNWVTCPCPPDPQGLFFNSEVPLSIPAVGWLILILTLFFTHAFRYFLPVSFGTGLGNILKRFRFSSGFKSRLEREGDTELGVHVGVGSQ